MANGDILGLLHAGDLLYDKDVVYNIEKNFRETESKLLYGHSEVYSANRAKIVRKNISPPYNKKLMSFGWFPSHQSVYIKKEIISMFGNYNEDFKIAGDYEFLLRVLIVHNVQAHMLDMFIVKFYLGGTSSKNFSSVIKANYECINAWNINNLRIPLYTIPLKLLRKKMQIIQQLISKI
jgi:glycosyltransferase